MLGDKGDAFPSIANFARRSLPFRRLAPGIAFKGFLADCGWIFEAPARRQAGKFGAHDKPPALKLRRRPLTGAAACRPEIEKSPACEPAVSLGTFLKLVEPG